ncbi:MAG: beta-eliminating lyase-related protein [Myxococcaceae bacterium]
MRPGPGLVDRRQFLAASGLAALAPTLTQATPDAGAFAPPPFKVVNFSADGLNLSPQEYALQLNELVGARGIEADNYTNGGLVAELEQTFASLLGKEAAILLPTGTLANHLAVRKLAGPDRRVLVQAESHLFNDTGDGAATLSDLTLLPLGLGKATVTLDEVKSWVERTAGGRVEARVGVISLESPVRRRDHEFVDFAELERISRYAREQGLRLHLDGARLFALPLHTGKSVREHAALFDTVYVSLWKHFNGAAGAVLAGTNDFIKGLLHTRRMFGGSLPQAWPSVALVTRYVNGFGDDYAKAWKAADQVLALLGADARFKVEKIGKGTSRFLMTLRGVTPEVFAKRTEAHDVVLPHPKPGTTTFPMQVNASLLRMEPRQIAQVLKDAATP